MDIFEQRRADTLILQPSGRLDSMSSQELQNELSRHVDDGNTNILLDFNNLEYISSAGLRVLLVVGKELKAKNGQLALCALNDSVQEVLNVSGFISLFPVFASIDQAMESSLGS